IRAPIRKPTAGGIWRYHPTRKIYEPYCHGTTNPWGMDWDEHGEMFFINTVIGHLWHGIQGAHFKRMHGEDPYPHIYGLIDQHADHYHWDTGKKWNETREAKGLTDELGGGHAHVGMMIYQGTNFPKEYRGKVFTTNLHGHRVNVDRIEREGSGYVGKHEPDFMKTDDPWFRAVEIQYGPDGGVYILDWSDIGECHEDDGVHRTSGRIYKITYGDPVKPKETDVGKLSDEELVKLQLSDNEWLVRMARWELRERYFGLLAAIEEGQSKKDSKSVTDAFDRFILLSDAIKPLHAMAFNEGKEVDRLHAAWVLQSTFAPRKLSEELASSENEHVAAWAFRFLEPWSNEVPGWVGSAEAQANIEARKKIESHANGNGAASSLRLQVASSLHSRLTASKRRLYEELDLVSALLSHPEDATDHNLPLMYWYGIRDLPSSELVKLVKDCRIPLVTQFIARRVTEDIDKDPAPLNALLGLAVEKGRTGFQPVKGGILPPSQKNEKQDASRDGQDAHPPQSSQLPQTPVVIASDDLSTNILIGMTDALKGWRKAKKPAAWDKFAAFIEGSAGTPARNEIPSGEAAKKNEADKSVRAPLVMLRALNVLFGDGRALDEVRAVALDEKANIEARKSALATLVEAKSPDARKICEKLLSEHSLALAAVQGLTTFDDPAIAEKIIKRWRNFSDNEHAAVIAGLVSRPSFARVLLKNLEGSAGVPLITREDITPVMARQIRSFNDPALTKLLAEVWGEVHDSSDDKKKLIASLKTKLTPGFIARGDQSQGRALYAGICAACHKLYGEGNTIGPDLTGSGRHDIGYLIENIADPSAVVAADFTMFVVTLKDGRV
ncbi:MAG: PVC-type heme-binding CxxCH protein, partial [Verrucomicrobiaceae bacterium]